MVYVEFSYGMFENTVIRQELDKKRWIEFRRYNLSMALVTLWTKICIC